MVLARLTQRDSFNKRMRVFAYSGSTSFQAGEVMASIKKPINVTTKFIGNNNGQLVIGDKTKRKALVNHAYLIMCQALGNSPSLSIDIDDELVMKHAGLGSSGATLGAVCASINELYGSPIDNLDLISYIANNYGEEIEDDDRENMKLVQCIGGSIADGLTEGGIAIITGNAVPIMTANYDGNAVVAIPEDYVPLSAKELMEREEAHMSGFQEYGEKYASDVAYKVLHRGLPQLCKGDMSAIADAAFDHRFNRGSIQNCSFVYPRVNEIAKNVRHLYENGDCDMLAMSSVGPAFFALVDNKEDELRCLDTFAKQKMSVSTVSVHNGTYDIKEKE